MLAVSAALLLVVGHTSGFAFMTQKWAPGANTAQLIAPHLGTPGGATWSIMGANLGIQGLETHGGALTTPFGALIGGPTTVEEMTAIAAAINTWSSVCNFTNLGMVADGGVNGGAPQQIGGHLGDIRLGSLGGFPVASNLAHAYEPGTETLNGAGGTLYGDVHFNIGHPFVDDPFAPATVFDFHTVALHEIGHAIGLDHSTVVGSVMYPFYGGARRSLHADDILGAQTLYGPVPEPATMALAGAALAAPLARRRRRS